MIFDINYLFVIIFLLVVTLIYTETQKTRGFVKKNSNLLQEISNLNKIYKDEKLKYFSSKEDKIVININESYKSKATFDELNGEKVLAKVIKIFIDNIEDFGQRIIFVEKNQTGWKDYCEIYEKICLKLSQFHKKKYIRSEKKVIKKNKLPEPVLDGALFYVANYDSKKGRSHYDWTWEYSFQDIKLTYEDALNEIEYQKSKEHFKKIQRNKINDNTRFEVFKRDGYRCRICGTSPEKNPEITLHLDHVIPIALGGNSDIENLQTLCSSCNMGKKAKLM